MYIFLAFSLYPGDLYAFTRRPTFLIVDSDNSSSFGSFGPNTSFEQPLVVLMSPQDVPSTFRGETSASTNSAGLGISAATREQPSNEKLINIGYGNYKLMQPWQTRLWAFLDRPIKQRNAWMKSGLSFLFFRLFHNLHQKNNCWYSSWLSLSCFRAISVFKLDC